MKVISSYLDSHFNENFAIHEVGMKLIPEHQSKIWTRLQSLESRAPAISSTHLKFTNEGKQTKGELSIIGAGRKFRSEIRGENPWEVYKSLEKEIDKQLIQWKRTRFLDKHTDFSILNGQQQITGGYAV
jgi:hypothetical protein